jgi:hypothetical protein
MNFYLDEAFFTSVSIIRTDNKFENKTDLTVEETLEALAAPPPRIVSFSSTDHPEFTKLRIKLAEEGYLYVERGWWNGDQVLQPFTLNGKEYSIGDQFPCASAQGVEINVAKQRKMT